jgi:photosystem II stability/assembly factor-like uncharacterized protein
MKKITFKRLAICIAFLSVAFCNAQIEFVGTDQYGRLRDIIYDTTVENRMYAATISGNHIVVSNDNGMTWSPFYSYPENGAHLEDLRLIGDNKLGFHLRNTQDLVNRSVYIVDIPMQTISHQAQLPIPNGATNVWVKSFDVFEGNNDIIIASQGYSIGTASFDMVYYTSDGGQNWTIIYDSTTNNSVAINNVKISPENSQKLYMARGLGSESVDGGLWISEETGTTWIENLAGIPLQEMAFNPSDANILYIGTYITFGAVPENLFNSTDGGQNWTAVPVTWTDHILNNITGIYFDPIDNDNIAVLEENEIVLSNDGGDTWTNQVYPIDAENEYHFGLNLSFNPFNTNESIVSADFRCFRSLDGLSSLEKMNFPFFNSRYAGTFSGMNNQLYYEVQNGISHVNTTTNTTDLYNVENIDFVGSIPSYIIDKHNDGVVFQYIAGFIGNELKISTDNGASFSTTSYTSFNSLITIKSVPNASVAWISTVGGNAGFVTSELARVDYSSFPGTFTIVNTPQADIPITSIYIDPNNGDHVIIAQEGYLYSSVDGGSNWTDIGNGIDPNNIIFDIAKNPFQTSEYLIATATGIYKTSDMANWSQVYDGIVIRRVEYSTDVQDHVLGATYTNTNFGTSAQILYSSDSGDNWGTIPLEDIEYTSSTSVDFSFSPTNAYAYLATPDFGVIKFSIDINSLSIDDNDNSEFNISYYPNPVKDKLNFESSAYITTAKLYNILGKEIMSLSVNHYFDKINMSQLTNGVYILKLLTTDGKSNSLKIIKK